MAEATLTPPDEVLEPTTIALHLDAALAEARALHQHDHLLDPDINDAEAYRIGKALRATWRNWQDRTSRLLERHPATLSSTLEALRLELAMCGAMLKQTPELIAERMEQVRRGDTVSMKELRDELRARRDAK
ncbi:MAG: hypothetical protein AAF743_05130 [Planctomycetota bacterium]